MFNIFDLYALLIIILSSWRISTYNIITAVLILAFIYFRFIWILFLCKVEFIAVSLFIVYLGAIVVLFLFVIRRINPTKIKKNTSIYPVFFIFFGLFFFLKNFSNNSIYFNIMNSIPLFYNNYNLINYTNIESLGRVLYTSYLLVFWVCGLILFRGRICCILVVINNKTRWGLDNIFKVIYNKYDLFTSRKLKKTDPEEYKSKKEFPWFPIELDINEVWLFIFYVSSILYGFYLFFFKKISFFELHVFTPFKILLKIYRVFLNYLYNIITMKLTVIEVISDFFALSIWSILFLIICTFLLIFLYKFFDDLISYILNSLDRFFVDNDVPHYIIINCVLGVFFIFFFFSSVEFFFYPLVEFIYNAAVDSVFAVYFDEFETVWFDDYHEVWELYPERDATHIPKEYFLCYVIFFSLGIFSVLYLFNKYILPKIRFVILNQNQIFTEKFIKNIKILFLCVYLILFFYGFFFSVCFIYERITRPSFSEFYNDFKEYIFYIWHWTPIELTSSPHMYGWFEHNRNLRNHINLSAGLIYNIYLIHACWDTYYRWWGDPQSRKSIRRSWARFILRRSFGNTPFVRLRKRIVRKKRKRWEARKKRFKKSRWNFRYNKLFFYQSKVEKYAPYVRSFKRALKRKRKTGKTNWIAWGIAGDYKINWRGWQVFGFISTDYIETMQWKKERYEYFKKPINYYFYFGHTIIADFVYDQRKFVLKYIRIFFPHFHFDKLFFFILILLVYLFLFYIIFKSINFVVFVSKHIAVWWYYEDYFEDLEWVEDEDEERFESAEAREEVFYFGKENIEQFDLQESQDSWDELKNHYPHLPPYSESFDFNSILEFKKIKHKKPIFVKKCRVYTYDKPFEYINKKGKIKIRWLNYIKNKKGKEIEVGEDVYPIKIEKHVIAGTAIWIKPKWFGPQNRKYYHLLRQHYIFDKPYPKLHDKEHSIRKESNIPKTKEDKEKYLPFYLSLMKSNQRYFLDNFLLKYFPFYRRYWKKKKLTERDDDYIFQGVFWETQADMIDYLPIFQEHLENEDTWEFDPIWPKVIPLFIKIEEYLDEIGLSMEEIDYDPQAPMEEVWYRENEEIKRDTYNNLLQHVFHFSYRVIPFLMYVKDFIKWSWSWYCTPLNLIFTKNNYFIFFVKILIIPVIFLGWYFMNIHTDVFLNAYLYTLGNNYSNTEEGYVMVCFIMHSFACCIVSFLIIICLIDVLLIVLKLLKKHVDPFVVKIYIIILRLFRLRSLFILFIF